MYIAKRRGLRAVIIMTTILAVGACSKDSTDVTGVPTCTSGVSVAASAGVTPNFTWTPNCSVAGLFVQRVSDGKNMWTVSTTDTPLKSGITYGDESIPGTTSAALTLSVGTQYRVGLVNASGTELATRLFTP